MWAWYFIRLVFTESFSSWLLDYIRRFVCKISSLKIFFIFIYCKCCWGLKVDNCCILLYCIVDKIVYSRRFLKIIGRSYHIRNRKFNLQRIVYNLTLTYVKTLKELVSSNLFALLSEICSYTYVCIYEYDKKRLTKESH